MSLRSSCGKWHLPGSNRCATIRETNLRVLHVTPAFYPATFWGGPIFSLYGLCNALVAIPGVAIRVLTTDSAGPRTRDRLQHGSSPVRYPGGYQVHFSRRIFGADISPALVANLWSMVAWSDVVHLTAVYSSPTFPTLFAARLLRKPVVWSPGEGFSAGR